MRRQLVPVLVAIVIAGLAPATAGGAWAATPPDDTPTLLTPKGEHETGVEDESFVKLRDAYYATRLLAGDTPLSVDQAAALRESASQKASGMLASTQKGAARGGTWVSQGPDPIVQNMRTTNRFGAMSGRVSALAIRNDGSIILGAAQGGVWTYDAAAGTWTSRTPDADTQSVGALAVAPSNDKIVYLGTGEANLSGDSYFGDGVWRSADGGVTWTHVSTRFTGQSVSSIVVDPKDPQHLFASTLRGRGGARRTTAPTSTPYGIYESTNGGAAWTLRKGTTDEFHGATNLVMDPQSSSTLWASFWGDGIYRTTDGGKTWTSALGDLPAGDYNAGGTRFALGVSHPSASAPATLYVGFDWFDLAGAYHAARVFKTTDGGTHWTDATGTPASGPDSVVGYCGTQCFYDNVIAPDPTDPNVVYALGIYGYSNSPQSGGIFRSTDGGATWVSLGYDLHPDFHAMAFQPTNTKHIAIGNDGGVWQSSTGGGRTAAGAPLSAADWENLNGTVDPATARLIHSTGLAITQFTSVATVPKVPGQYWGGTQDNGTLRKSLANTRWFDQASGDGGQVIVDQTTPNPFSTSFPAFVFGTYFGISPYRYDPAHVNTFFGNEAIDGGINLSDRAEFYIPWVQNRANPNQMFLGTYRLYRSDNAETPRGADVTWKPVSGDLTTGCTGTAPNGARGCLISAVGIAEGGTGAWVGTDDAVLSVSPDAGTAATPSWSRVGQGVLPNRPITSIAVDRSNWRIAYVGVGGFGAATPSRRGHVFATTDGGRTLRDVTANLPDVPVNSIVIDPVSAQTLYVATDVGTFVSVDGGKEYKRLGSGMPKVATWQLDYDATNGVLAAGTHGRGAYTLQNRNASSALVVSTTDTGKPVGPGSVVDYTTTVKNVGNALSKDLVVSVPVPANTAFVSADNGGRASGPAIRWQALSIPAGGQLQLHWSVRISASLASSVTAIVSDGVTAKDGNDATTSGSPHVTPIAPARSVSLVATTTTGGAKVGSAVTYPLHLTNLGYLADSYALAATGTFPATVLDATCTTPLTATATVQPGATSDACLKVTVPAAAADETRDVTTVTATSSGAASVTSSAAVTTIAVANDTLLVDGDGDIPDVAARYKAAMGSRPYAYWDLAVDPDLPSSYLSAHKNVVWWTGNSYPGPVSPYEPELATFLDGGGRLMLSGQDILDQAAGTTSFVQDYLHVAWDGTETQNDKATATVTGVTGNPVTGGLGSVAIDHTVLGAAFEDQVTPIPPGAAAFTDSSGATDALTVASGAYKVFFLAFPVEAFGAAADQVDLMNRTFTWFAAP